MQLFRMLEGQEVRGVPLLVLANKQDLPKALPIEEVRRVPSHSLPVCTCKHHWRMCILQCDWRQVKKQLDLETLKDRSWHIQGACARTGTTFSGRICFNMILELDWSLSFHFSSGAGLHEGMEWLADAVVKFLQSTPPPAPSKTKNSETSK